MSGIAVTSQKVAREAGPIARRCSVGHLKRAAEDALLLRGSRDFATLAEHRRFVDELVGRRNARSRNRIEAERAMLRPLPPRRAEDCEEVVVTVTSSGGFMLRKVGAAAVAVRRQVRVQLKGRRFVAEIVGTGPVQLGPAGPEYGAWAGEQRRA